MKLREINKHALIKFLSIIFVILLVLTISGCGADGWDNLDGGGSAEVPSEIDNSTTEALSQLGPDILATITDEQKNINYTDAISLDGATKIQTPGVYQLSGTIEGQINVKVAGVVLLLDNVTITNPGKKVISSDFDLIIILLPNTNNIIDNTNLLGEEANAISTSGSLTINGSGSITINSSKSAIKSDQLVYALGGVINLAGKTGHGISADSIIVYQSTINVTAAAKDGLHAETDDEILADDPVFDSNRGYVYIGLGSRIEIKNVYGDGIQADTMVLIDGGVIDISTIAIFVTATSSDGCYKLVNGTYVKVAKENSKNYSSLYQLQDSTKGIKVGEIDYELDGVEYEIVEDANYSLIINGGQININTTDDAIHSNSGNVLIGGGTITISTADDAICADYNVTINNATITINQSYEGIEGETININSGYIIINATDDGINASNDESNAVQRNTCYIIISGGIIFVNSSGDGVDSNGSIHITGGELYIIGPNSGGDAALDSDSGIKIDGGIVIAIGASGMVETPGTNSLQASVSINLSQTTSGAVSVVVNGEVIAYFDPYEIFGITKSYQSIVISLPQFATNQTYQIVTGTIINDVTISGILTKVGNSAGGNRGK